MRPKDAEDILAARPVIAYKRILVPLDGSPFANDILPKVQELALCAQAEVLLLRVVSEPNEWPVEAESFVFSAGLVRTGAFANVKPEPMHTRRAIEAEHTREAAQASLDAAAAELTRAGLSVETLIQEGNPAQTILEVAEHCCPDVIAMSTHGRGGIQRFLMGSVATRVLEHAKVPLLIVRHPQMDSYSP